MIDSILLVLQSILTALNAQYGVVGTILGWIVLVIAPVATVLLDLADYLIKVFASTKVQAEADAIEDAWVNKILPWLEVIPHANIPLAAGTVAILGYLKRAVVAVTAAVKSWTSSTN